MGGSGRISPTSAIAVPTDFPNSVRGGGALQLQHTHLIYTFYYILHGLSCYCDISAQDRAEGFYQGTGK